MKHPTGTARPRRVSAHKKNVRLNLQRRPNPEPEDILEARKKSNFGKWVLLVALLHLIALGIFYFIYEMTPAPKPPEQFISLLPEGDVVKGIPGTQEAPKIGPSTPAPAQHHASTSSATAVKPPKPVHKKPTPPKPPPKSEMKMPAPSLVPLTPTPPTPPKPPKVKVDLSKLEDAPASADTPKPKTHLKKPAKTDDDSQKDDDSASKPDSSGLSKEQIAAKLGDKLDAAGAKNQTKIGTSGSTNSHANDFQDFYDSIRDQVMSQWESPNLADETAVNPIVQIHVEKDGRVPPDLVHLVQSSGNATYDDSAVTAAKGLGYLHEPLPDGCPPDIPITFKLTR